MNITNKVFVGLAVVVLVAGIGFYATKTSRPSNLADNSGTVETPTTPTAPATPTEPTPSTPTVASAAIDGVSAALQADLNAQSSAIAALDQSTNLNVSSVDAANSSKQPYDENAI